MKFDLAYVTKTLESILSVDSPSGFTHNAMAKLKEHADQLGVENYMTNKGNIVLSLPGKSDKTVGLAAHTDTLGLIVRSVNSNGTLRFMKVGGPVMPSLDGEYCKVYTRTGQVYTGTVLSNSPAKHVFMDADTLQRNEDNMHIRLDERVKNKADTLALGIQPGDYICYDPKFQVTKTGFIKSRFLDDKLSVSLILGVVKYIKENNIELPDNVKIIFTGCEEVGHGLAYLPEGITELLAVDMGCIGMDMSCTEYDVSICAKDSGGPYDYHMTSRLINLAKDNGLGYAVDIYPQYASDVTAAYKAGHDVRGALIGSGVAASHGMERTHLDGVVNTMKLTMLYLMAEK